MNRLLCFAIVALAAPLVAAERPPNVVFILADDLGWTDLGCQGSKYYRTPNIDRMAAEGLRCTAGYSCGPNCQPTRAALMSGQYGPRTGVYTVGGINRFDWQSRPLRPVDNVTRLNPEVVTFAEALKEAGYRTGQFGKWHLGDDAEHHPLAQGFDESITSAGQHFNFKTQPKVDVPDGAYLADWLTDKAVDFIQRHKNGPFLLCLHHFGVHSPYQAKDEWIARFKDQPAAGGHHDPTYAAMIASVDESVGRVLKTLDELKLTENTLVVFTSDNGGVGGYAREGIKKRKPDVTDNAPLRSGKGSLYEGGIRVPYLFRWPGTIEPGRVADEPLNSVDLYPTLLELSGAKRPAQALDGQSYAALLHGKPYDRGPLYWHFPGYLGAGQGGWRTTPVGVVHDGDWKLLEFFEDGRLELYNLREDVGEQSNLAEKMPDKAEELHKQLAAWRSQIGAQQPTPNEPASSQPKTGKKRRGKKQ